MNIGIPKETRPSEYRVGISPAGVSSLSRRGHTCYVEHDAGLGVGFTDEEYMDAGAKIVYSAHEAFGRADLVLKFARPTESEVEMMQPGSTLAGVLMLTSSSQAKIDMILKKKITTFAYEEIIDEDGIRPVYRVLSEIGGRVVPIIASNLLQNHQGGKGILVSGIAGVPPAEVVIVGGGSLGSYATKTFVKLGAHVTVLDNDAKALQLFEDQFDQVVTMFASKDNIKRACAYADVVIAAAALPNQRAPIVITRDVLKGMKRRSIIIDAGIDQGGCVETSRPTTHDNPTFIEEGVVHYCVPNIPSIVARTATHGFFNATKPYILELVEQGIEKAIEENSILASGITTFDGKLVNLPNRKKQGEG